MGRGRKIGTYALTFGTWDLWFFNVQASLEFKKL